MKKRDVLVTVLIIKQLNPDKKKGTRKKKREGVMISGWCKCKTPAPSAAPGFCLASLILPMTPPPPPLPDFLFLKPTSQLNILTSRFHILPLRCSHTPSSLFPPKTRLDCPIFILFSPLWPSSSFYHLLLPLLPSLLHQSFSLETRALQLWPRLALLFVIPLKLHVSINVFLHILKQTVIVLVWELEA